MHPPIPDLMELVHLFYDAPSALGEFVAVAPEEMPEPYRGLLAHDQHMTVTVERHHGCLVDVHVIETRNVGPHYCRKIILTRQSDGRVVLFGIVRMDLDQIEPATRDEILARQKPLGRVLIEHNVLREVELVELWKVSPGADLRSLMELRDATAIYGRTALIHCNDRPAVELLEIVPPVD